MAKAYTCDVCKRYFSADPQSGAHTTLYDGIAEHDPIDICPECTRPVLEFIDGEMKRHYDEYMKQQEAQTQPEEEAVIPEVVDEVDD